MSHTLLNISYYLLCIDLLFCSTFNTRNIPNPRDDQQQHHQRTGSTDRQLQAQNLSYPSTPVSGSAATMSASTTTENARPTFIGGKFIF